MHRAKHIARRILFRLISLFFVFPPLRWALLCGAPTVEENAYRLSALLVQSDLRRLWILDDDLGNARRVVEACAPAAYADKRTRFVRRTSLGGVLAFLLSRAVFYSHGVYGSPPSGPHRVHVNVWHGSGPKRIENPQFTTRISSDLLTTNSWAWGRPLAADIGMDLDRLVVVGNSRQDSLSDRDPDEVLPTLGLDPARPVALWLPTYRRTAGRGDVGWTDGVRLEDESLRAEVTDFSRRAVALGVQLIVKPHPMDSDRFELPGVRRLTTTDLLEAGVSLYQFIGCVDALVSDYSGVWLEFLGLDRPLLLFCPDLQAYKGSRGFNAPAFSDVAKELIVERAADAAHWLADIAEGLDTYASERATVVARLGLADGRNTSEAVLRSTAEFVVANKSRWGRIKLVGLNCYL
ncbi:CDP-glycerol glycerophosphotransferase family protein [Petropleomorpha daqingensis]|uniref:CDP-glycerol glycerophosphotransferase, TagB/SpsB family n=1 Tax=Petropleomorpha daqingensis TaxID=2026353 RepID=A0A853CFB4_9ACTN|nr:hypothetical protein [Petropleomorpha daqingensis]